MFAFILNRRLNAVSIRAALSVALALSLVPTGTAQAELFWSHYRSGGWDDYGPFRSHHYRSWGWDDYEPFRQKRHRTNKGYELEKKPSITVVIFCWRILLISESMDHHDSEIMDDRSID